MSQRVKPSLSARSLAQTLSQGRLEQSRPSHKKVKSNQVATEAFLTSASTLEGGILSKRLLFHPESYGMLIWDLLLISLIIYQAFAIPYIVCFDVTISGALGYFEFITNVVFMCDVGVNFNTAYFAKGAFVTNRRLIARHYMQFWFWADALSTFPYSWMFGTFFSEDSENNKTASSATKIIKLIRIFRFLRILRLIRLAKLKRILFKIEDFISSNAVAGLFVFLRLLFLIFFLAHWTACWFYYVSYTDAETNPQTWQSENMKSMDNTLFDVYITSLYWAFTTMSTVGYGDVVPFTASEKIYATFAMIMACGSFAYTVGSIGNLVSKSSAESTEYREQVMAVNRYMRKKDLPKDLQFRVRRYLEYLWDNKKQNYLNEKEILSLLSEPLRDELYDHVHGSVIKSCPSFEGLEMHFIGQLSKLLETETFAPGDVIFESGEVSTTLYFIQNGRVDVYHQVTNSSFRELRSKQFFGEIAFFTEKPRCASVRCMDFVDLFGLQRRDLEQVAEKFPVSKEKIELMTKRCLYGDLSALHIRCYICKELGHTASKCSRILVNFNHEKVKMKWLESRKGHSKYVNPNLDQPSPVRRSRVHPRLEFSSRNVVGVPRQPEDVFPEQPIMWDRVKEYGNLLESFKDLKPKVDIIDPKPPEIKNPPPERVKHRLTKLISDDDLRESSQKEEMRSLSFRTDLVRSNPPAPVVEMEMLGQSENGEQGPALDVSMLSDDTDKPLFSSNHMRPNPNESQDLEGDFDYSPQVDVPLLYLSPNELFHMPHTVSRLN